MKKLILVRHGKSSWKTQHDDRNRPLKKRGHTDGELVAKAFAPFFSEETKVFTSPAVRAKTTAQIFKSVLKINDSDFNIAEELYTFDDERILEFIKSRNNNLDEIMLFGHNPAFTALADDLGSQDLDNLPTTGLMIIEFPVSTWKEIKKGTTVLRLFPKDLK
ncbi:MAG TPA: histidine phosphatase family protein [Flavobacteriaceae bacterium]|nr:histidine phosphatase family protein [Flavobacteriaceae bacterium]